MITVKGGTQPSSALQWTDATFWSPQTPSPELTDDGLVAKPLTDIFEGDRVKARGRLTVTKGDAGNASGPTRSRT